MEGWDLYGGEERDGKKAFERSIALAARLVGRTSRACSHEIDVPVHDPSNLLSRARPVVRARLLPSGRRASLLECLAVEPPRSDSHRRAARRHVSTPLLQSRVLVLYRRRSLPCCHLAFAHQVHSSEEDRVHAAGPAVRSNSLQWQPLRGCSQSVLVRFFCRKYDRVLLVCLMCLRRSRPASLPACLPDSLTACLPDSLPA